MMDASIRESLQISGTICGPNVKKPCTLRVVRVSIPILDIWEYVSAEIEDAPTELPDGDYEVVFERRRFKARKTDGQWQSRYL